MPESNCSACRESAIQAIFAQPLVSKPGKEFHYANDNYQLSAAIIELVSGRTYQEFVTSELFTSLSLENTGQLDTKTVQPRQCPGNRTFPRAFFQPIMGTGRVLLNHSGLFRWFTALQKGEVLQNAWVEKLFAPIIPIREGASSLGWFVRETESGIQCVFSRGNEDFGANSLLYVYPERDTVIIVLTQAGNKDGNTSYSRAIHHWLEKQIL